MVGLVDRGSMNIAVWVAGLVGVSSIAGAAPAMAEVLGAEAVREVAEHLVGVMETSRQAATNPKFVAVRMTTCEVSPAEAEAGAVYLYQEQALVRKLGEPYRQRFLQVALAADGQRVESRTFKPEDVTQWVGLCDREQQKAIANADLGERVCTVALRPSVLGGYVGSTPAGGCPVTLRGASWLTNVVVLFDQGMETWDRGLDEAGTQLWGAEDEPYRYRWVED